MAIFFVGARGDMPAFQALSSSEKWHVTRQVAKGESPPDPRLASAAVELAEHYQRRGHEAALYRGLAIVLLVGSVALAILGLIDGDVLSVIAMALISMTQVGHLIFNPMVRPRHLARSLEASRLVAAAGNT